MGKLLAEWQQENGAFTEEEPVAHHSFPKV